MAIPEALADATACYQTYTNATTACSTAQQNTDNAAWNSWDADNNRATTTLNSTLAQDWTNFNNSVIQCHIDYSNHIVTCRAAYNIATAAAWNIESNQLAACQAQYSDTDPLLYVCVCPDIAAYNYANAVAYANWDSCSWIVGETYAAIDYPWVGWDHNCSSAAAAIKSEDDSAANAGYNFTIGAADAICDATRTLSDNFTAPLCNAQAACNYNNCLLDVDCGQTPANCCNDGCAKTWNNSLQSAYSTYMNRVGPATYTYTFKIEMCPVDQQSKDATAQYSAQFTIDQAFIKRDLDLDEASRKNRISHEMDAATANDTIAICACNSGGDTSDTQYVACAAQAIATQTNNDASASAAYNQVWGYVDSGGNYVKGSAYAAYDTTHSNALATAQAAYTADYSQMTNCLATTQSTLQSVTDSANTQYNNSAYSAWQALVNCLQGCNGG